ncbi:hypothetical protein E2320_018170, partial [Naja naja]
TQLNKCIGKAATTFSRLTKRSLCLEHTLVYYSESWTLYAWQERKLNTFPMRCLRCILGITWHDKVPNSAVLQRAGIPS